MIDSLFLEGCHVFSSSFALSCEGTQKKQDAAFHEQRTKPWSRAVKKNLEKKVKQKKKLINTNDRYIFAKK